MKRGLQVLGDKWAHSGDDCKGDHIEDCTHKQRHEASYQSIVNVLQENT